MKYPLFDPHKFNLQPGNFDHQSLVHGINHTYRVMCHCLYLGMALELERETRLAFCSAFIHDLSRKHDSYCTQHGYWASNDKLPMFADFFISQGINAYELEEIKVAVRNHSEGFELEKDNAFYPTTALLKDADALDRIRLGRHRLNPAYLRFSITHTFIPFAHALFLATNIGQVMLFGDMLKIAKKLEVVISSNA